MAKKLSKKSYIHIAPFMVEELGLKGNELLIYAIIAGYNADDESNFHGSLEYLQTWTNSSKQGVLNAIDSLIDKGLLNKRKVATVCYYTVNTELTVKKVDTKSQESLPEGSTKLTESVKKVDTIIKDITKDIKIYNTDDFPEPEDCEIKVEKKFKSSFSKSDYSESVKLITSCQNTLKSKKIQIDETQYPIPALNKWLKKWFTQYGVEQTKNGIKNSLSNTWLINTAHYSLSALFSDTVFPKLVNNQNFTNNQYSSVNVNKQNHSQIDYLKNGTDMKSEQEF